MAVGRGNNAPLTEQHREKMIESKEVDRALKRAVIHDGEHDLLGAYRLVDCALRNNRAVNVRELESLERVQAIMGLVIYAALKAIPTEELDPQMQAAAQAIQQHGLTRFVHAAGNQTG